jgi:putative Flp pilus-assembly TadE/G-like protein
MFRSEDRGQTLIIVALMLSMLFGFVGLVADIGWYEVNLIRVQRAADAAALAGVVFLPSNVSGAVTAAKNESAKNGFADGVAGVTVTAAPDPVNDKVLGVTVRAPVRTWFARLFGVTAFSARRNGRAEFILPVPMGSPQDYLGIYKLFQSDGTAKEVKDAPDASNGPKLDSQGFWAAVLTRGGQHSNGDAYSPAYNGGTNPNTQFDANGYSYTIEIPTGGSMGEVWLFDATFCAVGHGSTGSYLGTGDHWIGPGGAPVTTTYRLWDTQGTPYTSDDDVLMTDSGLRFDSEDQVDKGSSYRGDQAYSDGGYNGSGSSDCQNDPDHNDWYRLANGLIPGMYRLQVTTSALGNASTNAENMFGIQIKSNGPSGARVYGTTKMCLFNNLDNATSLFYLAQIPASHAGKTLEIRLFDPGDVGGTAFLRIKKPTPTGYVNAAFNYTAAGGSGSQSGSNVTQLQTANSGSSLYQNAWVTIQIPLPASYGVGGLTPPGETEPAWWKIEYQISQAGNDTTTWEVGIRGNPVHLITP